MIKPNPKCNLQDKYMEAWLNEELNRQPSKLLFANASLAEAHLIRASGFSVQHQELQVQLACTVCAED